MSVHVHVCVCVWQNCDYILTHVSALGQCYEVIIFATLLLLSAHLALRETNGPNTTRIWTRLKTY